MAYKQSLELCKQGSEERNKYEQRLKNIHLRLRREGNQKRKSSEISMDASPAKRIRLSMEERVNALERKLGDKTVSELQSMLELNQQKKSGKKNELMQRVVDGIIHGAIPKCPQCPLEGRGNKSFLKFNPNTGFYNCGGR